MPRAEAKTRHDGPDLRQRFERFARRFGEGGRAATGKGGWGADDYWQGVQDLFTRDVTARGLSDVVGRETPDAFRFFARELDFAALRARPWYQRYPAMGFLILQAMAFRLTPGRRVLFAVSTMVLLVAWSAFLIGQIAGRSAAFRLSPWLLLGATLLFVLLALELRDKLALKGDLEVARQIQFGLLPFEPYQRGGISVEADMRPANTVGGDYFDIIELPEGRLALVIGDVAGKGMPAALLMALLQGSLRTLLTAGLRGPELLAKLNAHLISNIPSNRLVTLFYAELDPAGGGLRYVNAGHNAPFLIRAGGAIERLGGTAVALGVVGEPGFGVRETPLAPGDRLFLYTDGITEAFDAKDDEYGEDRLEAVLRGSGGSTGDELIRAVLADVLRFCGPVRPRDDMTLMVVRRLG